VLADSLEKTTMNREHRNLLLDGQLVLISPYDPSAGFNVGNAMQRNKLIYALADASLVVSSDLNKGGTWAGAVEQLDKLKFVPSSFDRRASLRRTGRPAKARARFPGRTRKTWIRSRVCSTVALRPRQRHPRRSGLALFSKTVQRSADAKPNDAIGHPSHRQQSKRRASQRRPRCFRCAATRSDWIEPPPEPEALVARPSEAKPASPTAAPSTPAEALFAAVREAIQHAAAQGADEGRRSRGTALDVSNAQAKAWLQRLADEGVIEKQKKPAGYIVKQSSLFECHLRDRMTPT
jgi:DNA processing protein